MKGKCYSKVNRGQRLKRDKYQTPYTMTQSLFDVEIFDDKTTMLEPACGDCAIVKIIKENYFGDIEYYDIADGNDFLIEEKKYHYIITNPPYSLANEFIMKAKKIAEIKFCMLLPLNYLQGQKRYEYIYNKVDNFFLTKIYIFTRMPMLSNKIRKDGKYQTGMQAYAWYIWEKRNYESNSTPLIYWIDSKDHIVRRNRK